MDLHGLFRPQKDGVSINRRLKSDALFRNFAHSAQAEDLEAAGIGKDRPIPMHEVMEVAMLLNGGGSWAQHEVEGIAENNLGTDVSQLFRRHRLHGAVSPDRHKRRGLDIASSKSEFASSGNPIDSHGSELHV